MYSEREQGKTDWRGARLHPVAETPGGYIRQAALDRIPKRPRFGSKAGRGLPNVASRSFALSFETPKASSDKPALTALLRFHTVPRDCGLSPLS